MELQLFLRDTDQADSWMAKQEVSDVEKTETESQTVCFFVFPQALLGNQDVGDSLDAVEALVKRHEDFEKSLVAQDEKVKAVDEVATRLVQASHYATEDIDSQRKEVGYIEEERSRYYSPLLLGLGPSQPAAEPDKRSRGSAAGISFPPSIHTRR